MEIRLVRTEGYKFEATNLQGGLIQMGASLDVENTDFTPMQTLLASAAACSSIDMLQILTKQKAEVYILEVQVKAERNTTQIPATFSQISLHYFVKTDATAEKVHRAAQLSVEKYCSVLKMLEQTAVISFETSLL